MNSYKLTIIITLFFCIQSQISFCCTCVDYDTEIAYDKTDFIVKAKVLNIETYSIVNWSVTEDLRKLEIISNDEAYSETYQEVNVKIKYIYKGITKKKKITIHSQLKEGGNCGYNFEKGKKYLIYGHINLKENETNTKTVESYSTGLCTRTKFYIKSESKILKGLKADNKS